MFGITTFAVGAMSALAVSAQSAQSTASVSTAMIPTSNISSSCTSFLTTLNAATDFQSCMTPLVNLTSIYSPLSPSASNLTTTTAEVVATLTTLCGAKSGCGDGVVRGYLSEFWGACSDELTSANYNADVRLLYDYLYVINPFQAAVCSKDSSSGTYCILEIATGSTSSSSANGTADANVALKSFAAVGGMSGTAAQIAAAANYLYITTSQTASTVAKRFVGGLVARGDDDEESTGFSADTLVSPNTTTYRDTSLPYLFLSPNTSKSVMCSSCTNSIMAAYVAWEAQVPYALGLSSSPILGDQATLWKAITTTCGSNFTTDITATAGVLVQNGTLIATSAGEKAIGGKVVAFLMAGAIGLGMSVLA